jgi:uncharacterized protein
VLALHGLEGGARSSYVASAGRELEARGIRLLRMNFRSCSGEMNRLARSYNAGDTSDLAFVLGHVRSRWPAATVGAIGFSLGGNVLLKYLGERGRAAAPEVRAAVAVSVPFDLSAGARRLEEGWVSRFYTSYFLRKLRAKAAAKRALLNDHCDADAAIAARSIREFDEHATARLHGFRDAEDYYHHSSSNRWLERIRVPTLLVHSLDDPFLPATAVPREAPRSNPWLVDAIVEEGGHVGFVAGTPWRPSFWAEREAAAFLATHLHSPVPARRGEAPPPAGHRETHRQRGR